MMKKKFLTFVAVLLALNMLGGCRKVLTEPSETVESSSDISAVETKDINETNEPNETNQAETEGETESELLVSAYTQQIERYYTAISNQWDANAYFDHDMSAMASYYYEGNALDNIGFTFMDLNGDNIRELIIGAIENSDKDPLVFEIWTLKDGEPVMLAQSGSHNRYYMQYAEEDCMWSVAYEAENGAANYAVYYLHLSDGKFEVIQGILFDAVANENAPWFMTYDLDWDISNDTPIDEDTANAVMEAGRNIYTAVEYTPYSRYK